MTIKQKRSKDKWAKAIVLAAAAFASVVTLGYAEPVTTFQQCALVGKYPSTSLQAVAIGPIKSVRFDLLDAHGTLLGSQIAFENAGITDDPLLSSEGLVLVYPHQPIVRCSVSEITLTTMTHVDIGPQIVLHSVYLGHGSLTASFYAYEEDLMMQRKDSGLVNQLFSVRLDDRTPYQVQITAKPGRDVTVRFDGIPAGKHRIVFAEMDLGGPKMGYYVTPLWGLDFVQPSALGVDPHLP